ncbi:uncharacterized protein LOC120068327 [Benincasa hispida]|uniref:uncharacterized protein LOC120068327 n=1 Tax=Benincasa hispida TaxID=102211 RepID=UPI001900DA76|nr:uncharacterized protein LOC120068327 [Benincasa hispida]
MYKALSQPNTASLLSLSLEGINMGNSCVSYRIKLPCCLKVDAAHRKKQGEALKIVKSDGKVLEFITPTLVKDVLVNFSGFVIGSSQDASHHHYLSPDFELKMGQVYYMLPSPQPTALLPPHSFTEDSDKSSNTKRVRIVLTKKQLQQLLAKQVSMEDLIMQQLEQTTLCNFESSSTWKPALAAIPEGNEA